MTSILPTLTHYFQNITESVSQSVSVENQKKIDTLIQISFKILFSSALFIFVMGVLFRDYLIQIIATKDYLLPSPFFSSSDAFLVVFMVVIFYFISLIFIYTLIASHHQSKLLKINIVVTIFNLIGNVFLIPYYSFIGS